MSDSVNPPVVLNPRVQVVNQVTRNIEKRFESIAKAIGDCNGADMEATILINISTVITTLRLNGSMRWITGFSLPEESFLTIMKFLVERTHRNGSEKTFIERNMSVSHLLEDLQFREPADAYSSVFLEYALKWLEDCWVIVSTEFLRIFPQHVNSLEAKGESTIFKILKKLLVCDKERSHETRILKLFWNHGSQYVSVNSQGFWLSKIAKHYSSDIPESGGQEEFIKTDEDRASFLHSCSIADNDITSFHTHVNDALNQTEVYGQIARCWAEKEENLHTKASSCELAYAFSYDYTRADRLNTAKMCLDRLDFAKKISADLNPYNSDTFASVMDTVMSPELTSLNALKKESKLRKEVVHQVEKISEKHRQTYEAVKKQQYERLEEIFQARQKEVEDVVREAMYKKAKYMASVAKESISSAVTLTSEVVLKKIVEQAGGALKTAEGKQEAHRLEKAQKSECAVCFMEFTKKRKRACLDPCGHVNACFSCATKAWATKPDCPLCRVRIEKPIPLPAQLFF